MDVMTHELPKWAPEDREIGNKAELIAELAGAVESLRGYGAGPHLQNLTTALANVYDESHPASDDVLVAMDSLVSKMGIFKTKRERSHWPGVLADRQIKAIPEVLAARFEQFHDEPWTPEVAGLDSVEKWERAIWRLYKNGMAPDFEQALLLPNMANPPGREESLIFAIGVLGLEGPLRILDVACSGQKTLQGIALPEPSGPQLEVVDPLTNNIDERKTEAARQLMRDHPVLLLSGVGIDAYDPRQPEISRHIRSNSFYPDELKDEKKRARYQQLEDAKLPIEFQQVDATIDYSDPRAEELVEKARRLYGPGLQMPQFDEKFDVISARTLYGQLPPKERAVVLKNIRNWGHENSVLITLDFVYMLENGKIVAIPQKYWPNHYRGYVEDRRQRKPAVENYFDFTSGRGKQVIMRPAIGKLRRAREYGLWP